MTTQTTVTLFCVFSCLLGFAAGLSFATLRFARTRKRMSEAGRRIENEVAGLLKTVKEMESGNRRLLRKLVAAEQCRCGHHQRKDGP